jgi:hypothetical protein
MCDVRICVMVDPVSSVLNMSPKLRIDNPLSKGRDHQMDIAFDDVYG